MLVKYNGHPMFVNSYINAILDIKVNTGATINVVESVYKTLVSKMGVKSWTMLKKDEKHEIKTNISEAVKESLFTEDPVLEPEKVVEKKTNTTKKSKRNTLK